MGMKKLTLVIMLTILCVFCAFSENFLLSTGLEFMHANTSSFNGLGANVQLTTLSNTGKALQPGFFVRGDFAIFRDSIHSDSGSTVFTSGYGAATGLALCLNANRSESVSFALGGGVYCEGRAFASDNLRQPALFADVCYTKRTKAGSGIALGLSCYAPLFVQSEEVRMVYNPCIYLGFGF